MREPGVRGVLVDCADCRCSHSVVFSPDRWPNELRLSDIELRFICSGHQSAEVAVFGEDVSSAEPL
jgi:hypothetical protein